MSGWLRTSRAGRRLDRPGLEKALTYARAGRYDLFLVAKVDRLSRSIRGLTNLLDDLDTQSLPPAEPVLAELCANIRQAIDADEIAPKKAVISTLVQELEIRSRRDIYPTFRVPTASELDTKVRKLWRSVHPTCHNPNTPPSAFPLVDGPVIRLPGHHGKVRRGRLPVWTGRNSRWVIRRFHAILRGADAWYGSGVGWEARRGGWKRRARAGPRCWSAARVGGSLRSAVAG